MSSEPAREALDVLISLLIQRVSELESDLARSKEAITALQQERRKRPGVVERRFLSLQAAAKALGLGRATVKQLIAADALRVVRFPNGILRVPRSELERIDSLGLDVTLAQRAAPEAAPTEVAARKTDALELQPEASLEEPKILAG